MFGRKMSESLGKVHFLLTFIFLNGTFFPMHLLGARGVPRRYADPNPFETITDFTQLNQFMTYCAIGMAAAQLIFILNFFGSMVFGKRAGRNPWNGNTLEWEAPSPPPHGNFETQPRIYRGAYEYSHPDVVKLDGTLDHFPQTAVAAKEIPVD